MRQYSSFHVANKSLEKSKWELYRNISAASVQSINLFPLPRLDQGSMNRMLLSGSSGVGASPAAWLHDGLGKQDTCHSRAANLRLHRKDQSHVLCSRAVIRRFVGDTVAAGHLQSGPILGAALWHTT